MRLNRGVRWSARRTGAAILATVLAAGCGASLVRGPSSIHPTGSFTTVALKCAGISIYPSPGSKTASAQTQIAFRNAPAARFDAQTVTVTGSGAGGARSARCAGGLGYGTAGGDADQDRRFDGGLSLDGAPDAARRHRGLERGDARRDRPRGRHDRGYAPRRVTVALSVPRRRHSVRMK